jgi:hypothetical protein
VPSPGADSGSIRIFFRRILHLSSERAPPAQSPIERTARHFSASKKWRNGYSCDLLSENPPSLGQAKLNEHPSFEAGEALRFEVFNRISGKNNSLDQPLVFMLDVLLDVSLDAPLPLKASGCAARWGEPRVRYTGDMGI